MRLSMGTYETNLIKQTNQQPRLRLLRKEPGQAMQLITLKSSELLRHSERYREAGEEALRTRKLGVVILSGGQGTRLGSSAPKGLYKLKDRTLFEWHIDRVRELRTTYGADISVFVMTSSFTHDAVEEFFEGRDLGIRVQCFKQNNAVCVDAEERPLSYYDGYAEAPNGNGDVFESIRKVAYDRTEAINIISVDNVLAKILDPAFVGAFFSEDLDILSKSVTKKEGESVGAFVRDGKLRIREYSEDACNGEGIQGNICNHLFRTSFITHMGDVALPEHRAFKKIPHTVDGELVEPDEPNGYKREKFIFDAFGHTDRNRVMHVPREEEFAPLKNGMDAVGDNPEACATAIEKFRLVKN
jgi:UDP-N-acetylglucosamine pyrophosphorylase